MDLHLYIPFKDGAIAYDCPSCQATCCRAGLLGIGPATAKNLLELYPNLSLFKSSGESSAYGYYFKYRPSCFFLNEDNLCNLEVEYGREAKPDACIAHPVYFTTYRDRGVAFSLIQGAECQLLHEPPFESATPLGWKEIARLHEDAVQHAPAGLRPPGPWADVDLKRLIKAEEGIRDRADSFSCVLSFASWQLAYSELFLKTGDPQVLPTEDAVSEARFRIGEVNRRMESLLGTENQKDSEELQTLFLAYAPMLRVLLLGLVGDVPAYADRTSSELSSDELYRLAPALLVALYRLADAFASLTPDRPTQVRYETLVMLIASRAEHLFVLANLTAPIDRTAQPIGESAAIPMNYEFGISYPNQEALLGDLLDSPGERKGSSGEKLNQGSRLLQDFLKRRKEHENSTKGPLQLEVPRLVVAPDAKVSWSNGEVSAASESSGQKIKSGGMTMLALLNAFSSPRHVEEVLRQFPRNDPELLRAIIAELEHSKILTSEDSR